MFCKNCGVKLEENVMFCHNCGVQLNGQQEKTVDAEFADTQTAYNFIDDDVVSLIGKDKEAYYIARYAEMKQSGKKTSWNWCAFLFGPAWFIYRKMYLYGAAFWLLDVAFAELLGKGDLVLAIAGGLFGNYIYMIYQEKLALQAKNLHGPAKEEFLQKNGGTSSTAVFISMGVIFTLSFVGKLVFGGLLG